MTKTQAKRRAYAGEFTIEYLQNLLNSADLSKKCKTNKHITRKYFVKVSKHFLITALSKPAIKNHSDMQHARKTCSICLIYRER